MRKAMFVELKSGSEWFIAICVSRSKSLPEVYIGCSHHETRKIKIFIAMQPVKAEMIHDNYTTLQNTK